MWVPVGFMLDIARREKFALTRFTLNNLEMIQAAIEAAEEVNAPIVMSAYEPEVLASCKGCIESLMKLIGERTRIPAAMMFDHSKSFDNCIQALQAGYHAVMIDASTFPYEENVRVTTRVVEFAHAVGAAVEGEVGMIGTSWGEKYAGEDVMTDPNAAEDFCRRTGVDALAVSFGVMSGFYDQPLKLDWNRLAEIRRRIDVHLCLHGASFIPAEDVARIIDMGVSFTGYGTEFRHAFFKAIDEVRAKGGDRLVDPVKVFTPAKQAMKEKVKSELMMTQSAGKAKLILDEYERYQDSHWSKVKVDPKNTNVEEIIRKVTEEVIKNLKK